MSGPAPKPADQRVRRNRDGGTTSTSIALTADVPEIPVWAGPTVVVKLDGWEVEVPRPPKHASKLRKPALRAWVAYWTSPEAAMLRPQHMPALERLVLLYDEEARLVDAVGEDREVVLPEAWGPDGPAGAGELVLTTLDRVTKIPGRLAIGSTGQFVSAPEVAQLQKVRAEIRALEDRFAGSPMAQFRLGWQQAEMYRSQASATREADALVKAAARISERHEALLEDGS